MYCGMRYQEFKSYLPSMCNHVASSQSILVCGAPVWSDGDSVPVGSLGSVGIMKIVGELICVV